MAKLVGVFNTAHSPFCYMPPERWNEVRANRSLREDVPMDTLEQNQAKASRIKNGFATLKAKMAEVKPDVIVVVGDDQLECFDFNNFPSFAFYVGEEFEGQTSQRDAGFGAPGMPGGRPAAAGATAVAERPAVPKAKLKGHPDLGTSLMLGVMKRGFDPAFSMDMPKPEHGIGHAILRPAESITDMQTPIVPILVNCYYAPQPTAKRCYEFGKALREAIDEAPQDLRVAVVGSGGLWHTPGAKSAYLDEEFDREMLRYLEAGDIRGMAEHFDTYHIPDGDTSQYIGQRARQATGMPGFGGPQGGTRETCNWVIAAAVADGTKNVVVDYVPVYASPIGAAWAYATDL
jgi:aromatic ring-opening dioxygenase catalytic subunit (LigB family)